MHEGGTLMCTINGTCGCKGSTGSFFAALGWQLVLWLAKTLVQALQIAAVLLILAGKWAAPRAWRLARSGYRNVRHRYLTRPVVLGRQPAAELPQRPTGLTLADLRLKEPANR